MHGVLINVLRNEWRSRHEGTPPPPHKLVWLPWVGPFLRLFNATQGQSTETPQPLCTCGHPASEHPLRGACASCGCLGDAVVTPAALPQEA